jgi:hypothetical protein
MRCKDCERNRIDEQGRCEECTNCSGATKSGFYEHPSDRWLVRVQLSAEYRRRLGYSTRESGAEVPDDDE